MANTLRIKRRAAGGAAGAPASLANAELAFNEQDNTLYYGTGTGGAGGTATSVIAIGGSGAFVATTGAQTIAGVKTFSSIISGSIDGNAGTATKLATARTLGLSGDVTGTVSFDGSANATIAATLANSGVTAGTYGSASQVGQVTVDSKGRVTAASNVAITFPVTSVAGRTGAITLTTTDVSEGTNLCRAAIKETVSWMKLARLIPFSDAAGRSYFVASNIAEAWEILTPAPITNWGEGQSWVKTSSSLPPVAKFIS